MAFLQNVAAFPNNYVHLLKKSPKQVVGIVLNTLRGLTKGKNIPQALKFATNNAVSSLQRTFATDISQVLTSK